MRRDAHLTADELRGFAQHHGSAGDVRRIARHLQSCEECRGDSQARDLVSSILDADEEHLPFEQLAAIADGDTPAGEGHIRHCATCARELADLRQFREQWPMHESRHEPRPRRRPWAIAAALLIALLGGGFLFTRFEARRTEARLAEVLFPADALALHSRRLSFRQDSSAPSSSHPSPALDVIAPRDTVVLSDRPLFRWNAPDGATSVVEIFAPDFTRVAASPVLTGRTWTPPVALQRGVTYRWQVTVDEQTIPAPPLPEALFLVVPEAEAKAARDLEQSTSRPSLALAAAYAKAGDFDRAHAELRALLAAGKQTAAAEKLLRRINGVTR